MKKIGLLTSLDPTDKTAWSGIYFKIYESLMKHGFEVEILGPYPSNIYSNRMIFLIEKILKLFTKARYYQHGSLINSYFRGRFFSKKIKKSNCDLILGITPAAEFAFLKSNKPLIYFSDTTFGQLSSYYNVFSDLTTISKWEANYLEKRALNKSRFLIFPSNWASDYVIDHYGINENKVKILKMGSNIDFPEILDYQRNLEGQINFLFLGVDWIRKGGEIVVDAIRTLKGKGFNVKLTICGCKPELDESFVTIVPFLNKNSQKDYDYLKALLLESHFLFLPTKAECYGIVFAEASAYGLPSISFDTGGVSSVVEHGTNGILFKENDSNDKIIEALQTLLLDKEGYMNMCKKSRKYFEEKLDWKVFARQFDNIVESIE